LATVHEACANDVPREFSAFAFSQGLEAWMRAVFACNQYIDAQAPWALRKTDPVRMAVVLRTLVKAIRDLTIAVQPVIPGSAEKMLNQLGVPNGNRDFAAFADTDWYDRLAGSGFRLDAPMPLFPRLDMPAEPDT
jgi:methionyl-tRNA synthetase